MVQKHLAKSRPRCPDSWGQGREGSKWAPYSCSKVGIFARFAWHAIADSAAFGPGLVLRGIFRATQGRDKVEGEGHDKKNGLMTKWTIRWEEIVPIDQTRWR